MKKRTKKPVAVMLSKRANVFFLEYCRIVKQDDRVVYLTKTGADVESFFNIPEKNTVFIMLGNGTSITQAAVRKLAEAQVIVGFCGSGGSPNFASVDFAFLNMESEYRPAEYMQAWAKMWFDNSERLNMAKVFCKERLLLVNKFWDKVFGLELPSELASHFNKCIDESSSTQNLLLVEANWAKELYKFMCVKHSIKTFKRRKQGESNETDTSSGAKINDLLDHGNYIAYGYAAATLSGLGISYMFPVLHGKTRRGALVFDVADIFKDAIVLPLAFKKGRQYSSNKEFRDELIDCCSKLKLLDYLFGFLKANCLRVK